MIVYRFERDGLGPYVSGARYRLDTTNQKARKKYEHLYRKSLHLYRNSAAIKAHSSKEYIFGCSSKEQLRLYFSGNFRPLFRQGFRIKRYHVPNDEVIEMGYEVAFPVKYHKLQTVEKIEKQMIALKSH